MLSLLPQYLGQDIEVFYLCKYLLQDQIPKYPLTQKIFFSQSNARNRLSSLRNQIMIDHLNNDLSFFTLPC